MEPKKGKSIYETSKGFSHFIDYPKKVEGKMIFDGESFLGERHYFFKDKSHCSKKVKIMPNCFKGATPKYSLWGVMQQ